ncbi:uncharacterized protein I206_107272 [Kwoniella pini CBS 10737]|uniref:Phosphatidylglycerol/phosphatidylinositol transfer protein n=1 Tax=Kwoniella pini CBS 10737 TaxID=1296096 RepID=A0A1B9HYQ8_9TREE|nr:uncharacterized protein I206_05183 [Kwoniella pini CBS 10737]OCF48406.1 hypothetical protein I206_05183 [Kwoniella pini CBS 10737]
MHTSTLITLLPFLALPTTYALPGHFQHSEQKGPLPAFLRRQNSGALNLPPSLNSPTITNPTIDPTSIITASEEISFIQTAESTLPSLWQINTIPQTLLAQNQAGQIKATITSSPTSIITQMSTNFNSIDNDGMMNAANDTPSAFETGMTAVEYQGDSLLDFTSVSMEAIETAQSTSMDITAAAVAITSMVSGITASTTSSTIGQNTITSAPTSTFTSVVASSVNVVMYTSSSNSGSSSITQSANASASASISMNGSSGIQIDNVSSSPSAALPEETESKGKKIRYKHCSETKGTVTEIKIEPCEGGKGTILDPCHFQAGKNYTITLSYISPEDSISPRANLEVRDKTSSDGLTKFPYPGQSFDACQYTTCPIKGQINEIYKYEFTTLNNRFDQLTFNMTNGLDGNSIMCAYFPITFMPNMAGRSLKRNLPFGGIGSRW